MNVLGVSLGHDTNLALIEDGRVVAIVEAERYFRQKRYKLHCMTLDLDKHISGYQYVDLDELRLFLAMVAKDWGTTFDVLAVQNQGRVDEHRNLVHVLGETGFTFGQLFNVNHHLSHAALAYFTSPFPEAIVLSYDGMGNDGFTVLFRAIGNRLTYLERDPHQFGRSYNNLGYIVGIKPDVAGSTAGKTMGLAAYGEIRREWLPAAHEYVRGYVKLPGRDIEGLNNYGKGHRINGIGLNQIPELREFAASSREWPRSLGARLRSAFSSHDSAPLRLPGPEHPLTHELVHTVQQAWTEQVLEVLGRYRPQSANLCIVGGCALNGVTNYAVESRRVFDRCHLLPNPTDCGLAAGAALHTYYAVTNQPFAGCEGYFNPYLGMLPFDMDEMPALRRQYPHRDLDEVILPATVAGLVYKDRMVGVIRGRYEVGPRALGNRSILCNPLNPDMRTILNDKVKHREWYRPFAPVVTSEDAGRYFTNTDDIPYMSVICYTRPAYREMLPAITHVDGSARLQTIRSDQHPFLHETLKQFERLSGMPILLNTSFNPGGEPILNFCAVGLDMLRTTELDLVLIDNTLFCRPGREALFDGLDQRPPVI